MNGGPARRALLLGATGHLGQALLHALRAAGWQVSAATRQSRPEALAGLDVAVLRGDADDPGTLARWVPGHEAVFDAAAPYPMNLFIGNAAAPADGGRAAVLERATTRMAALLQATREAGSALVHVSSFTTQPRPASESPLARLEAVARRRLHPYFAVKAAMEALALQAGRAGQPVVVLNPSACLGPWDRRARDLCVVPLLVAGQVPALVAQPLNVIDVRDVAEAALRALAARCFGQPIVLSGHDSTADALAVRVCQLAGVPAPRRRLPVRLAAGASLAAEAGWAMLGRPSPVPALGTLLLLDSHAQPPSPQQQALGLVPRPLDETLRDAIGWYRRIGYC